jgi:NTP pyrophosphatase (non-canonical NTP hydrolase)
MITPENTLSFGEYQRLAHDTSVIDTLTDPDRVLLEGVVEESLEAFTEDGRGRQFLFLHGLIGEVPPKYKETIAKELGDILWYTSEAAHRAGIDLGQLSARAIMRHTGVDTTDTRMGTFDLFAQRYGASYFVVNHKMSAILQDSRYPLEVRRCIQEVSIAQNPGYVLQRVLGRLVRKLEGGKPSISGPLGNVDFEEEDVINDSSEDILWVMSAVAQYKLGTSLSEIATQNLTKVQRRKNAGTILEGEDPDRSQNAP